MDGAKSWLGNADAQMEVSGTQITKSGQGSSPAYNLAALPMCLVDKDGDSFVSTTHGLRLSEPIWKAWRRSQTAFVIAVFLPRANTIRRELDTRMVLNAHHPLNLRLEYLADAREIYRSRLYASAGSISGDDRLRKKP